MKYQHPRTDYCDLNRWKERCKIEIQLEVLKEGTKKILRSKKSAIDFLKRAGIYYNL